MTFPSVPLLPNGSTDERGWAAFAQLVLKLRWSGESEEAERLVAAVSDDPSFRHALATAIAEAMRQTD